MELESERQNATALKQRLSSADEQASQAAQQLRAALDTETKHCQELHRYNTKSLFSGWDLSRGKPREFPPLTVTFALSLALWELLCWITTRLPTPEDWKAELAWLADPYSGQFTDKVVICQQ